MLLEPTNLMGEQSIYDGDHKPRAAGIPGKGWSAGTPASLSPQLAWHLLFPFPSSPTLWDLPISPRAHYPVQALLPLRMACTSGYKWHVLPCGLVPQEEATVCQLHFCPGHRSTSEAPAERAQPSPASFYR